MQQQQQPQQPQQPPGAGVVASSFGTIVRRQQQAQDGAHGSRPPQRPVSLYDNLKNGVNGYGSNSGSGAGSGSGLEAGTASSVGNLHAVVHQPPLLAANPDRARTPSQANCLSTTVPQNMVPEGFSSRHAPTRTSLRHSRMIVMTREGRVPRKYQPPVLRARRLGTSLVALVSLLGVLVTGVAVWLLLWAPNLPARDVPSYSGPPLIAAGLTGLILLGCCRKDYPGRPYSSCIFAFKVVSISLAALAAVAALCAGAFALLHLVSLWGADCEPAQQLNATCHCHLRPPVPLGTSSLHYADLNCPEVASILTVILTGSCAANTLAGVLAGWYVLLHWSSRFTNVYSKVRTSEANPIVFSNKP